MATKDRTALKDEFKNGNLATGERFADLIDSMKVVQLPVVDPQALGTSLSFIDSITQDADGKITATKKTLDLSNAHELNPFKGWYKTGDTLPTDGFDGAYLYFKDTSEQTGLTTIYRWNGTTYAPTGTVVDTSNVQTFKTGQSVNEFGIDDEPTDGSGNLVKSGGMYTAKIVADYIDDNIVRNLFNKESEYLVGYITDSGQLNTAQGKTSLPIKCTPSAIYSIKIFNKTPFNTCCRFLDAQETPLKPLNPATNEEFSYVYNGNNASYQIKAPLTAAYMQFTLQLGAQYDDITDGLVVVLGGYDNIPEYFEGFYPLQDFINDVIDGNDKVSSLDTQINGEQIITPISIEYDAVGKYVGSTSGKISSYQSLSLAYFPILSGKEYHIHIPETCNNGGYLLSYASVADGATNMIEVLSEYGKGTVPVSTKDLVLNSEFTGFVAVGYNTGSTLPTVSEYDLTDCVLTDIEDLDNRVGDLEGAKKDSILYNKKVFFFGDSLTAASTPGMNGFAKLIAEFLGMPYKSFLFDAHDGNTSDVHIPYPCFVNYGKDGTTNAKTSSRSDSILERIKRHVDNSANSDVNYVLVEVGENDSRSVMGTISSSYTATYDEYTIIGAIEEAVRYLTTLGREIHIGYYIPWSTMQVPDDYFDSIIGVFEKWGVPFLDLRKSSGFYMRGCAQHRADYSMSADSYSSYNNTTTYNLDDKVKYGGNLYKCLDDNVVGILPTNTDYWLMVSSESYDGTHLNNLGHQTVMGKIKAFLESL